MKRFAIATIILGFLAISNHSSAQVRLGVASSTRLTSAANVSTPRISNALRASEATSVHTAKATASTAKAEAATAKTTIKDNTNASASASTSTNASVAPDKVHADADVKVKASH